MDKFKYLVHLKLLFQFGAGAAFEAGRDGRAFVDFVLTEGASESRPALALETLQRVADSRSSRWLCWHFLPVKPRAHRQR